MPKVGTKKFAYTAKGKANAKAYAKKTGKKVAAKKKKYQYGRQKQNGLQQAYQIRQSW